MVGFLAVLVFLLATPGRGRSDPHARSNERHLQEVIAGSYSMLGDVSKTHRSAGLRTSSSTCRRTSSCPAILWQAHVQVHAGGRRAFARQAGAGTELARARRPSRSRTPARGTRRRGRSDERAKMAGVYERIGWGVVGSTRGADRGAGRRLRPAVQGPGLAWVLLGGGGGPTLLAPQQRLPRVEVLRLVEVAVGDVRVVLQARHRKQIVAVGRLPHVDQLREPLAVVPQVAGPDFDAPRRPVVRVARDARARPAGGSPSGCLRPADRR